MIVLSTDKAVKDLLDKRSNIYSSRTELYLGNLVSGYLRVLLMVCFFASSSSTAQSLTLNDDARNTAKHGVRYEKSCMLSCI